MGLMGRLAAKTASDREMHDHLSAAVRSLHKALAVAARALQGADNPLLIRQARSCVARLKTTLANAEGVGNLSPAWDLDDPDLMPEDQKKAPPRPPRVAPFIQPQDGDD